MLGFQVLVMTKPNDAACHDDNFVVSQCLCAQVKPLKKPYGLQNLASLTSTPSNSFRNISAICPNGLTSVHDLGNALVAEWNIIPTVTLPYLVKDFQKGRQLQQRNY